MSQDFASIMTGEPAPKPRPAKKTYDPFDAAIRTVMTEERDPTARGWVAGVIANRAKAKGGDLLGALSEKNAFEPYGSKAWTDIDPNSEDYKATAALVLPILRGEAPDPSGGANYFYAPKAQAELAKKDGRPEKPEFDDGTGIQIGDTLFFRKGAEKTASLAAIVGAEEPDEDAQKAFEAAFGKPDDGAGLVGYTKGIRGTLDKPQTDLLTTFEKGGFIDREEAPGSVRNPLWMPPDITEKDVPPGAYYVTRGKDAMLKRAPGGDEPESSFARGMARGGGDVVLSVANLFPGGEDSTIRNRLEANQAAYDADLKGDLKSGLGRFTGQMLATVPLLAGGEAVVAPALTRFGIGRLAPVAADATAKARLAHLAARGGQLAASGSAEGAAGTLLTSSASDAPLEQQLATGALLGGVLKPAGGAITSGISRLIGGGKVPDAAAPDAQQAIYEAAQNLPRRVPLTQGEIMLSPTRQMAENLMAKGSDGELAQGVVRGFRAEQQQAIRENVKAIAESISGRGMDPGEGAAAASARLNAMRDVAKKAVDKAYDDARARGEDAMLATAAEVREGVLETLRGSYALDRIKSVASELERFGEGGAPTVRELYEMRSRLSKLTQSSDPIEGGAARQAVIGVDAYIRTALKNDLFLGDPKAVDAWKKAVRSRADFGKLFEGDDLIDKLTERVDYGGEKGALKVDPEEAVNYIFNRGDLGWIGKRNLGRDLKRMQKELGPDSEEWNGLRAEVFYRIARAGESAPEGGASQFSGQKFFKSWDKAKREAPQIVNTMFTPEERKLIDDFAEVAQVATTPVKGGDNTSNTTPAAKKLLDNVLQYIATMGGAGGGAVVGGPPGAVGGVLLGSFFKSLGDILAVGKARKATYGAKPLADKPSLQNKLIPGPALPVAGAVVGGRLNQQPPPQE